MKKIFIMLALMASVPIVAMKKYDQEVQDSDRYIITEVSSLNSKVLGFRESYSSLIELNCNYYIDTFDKHKSKVSFYLLPSLEQLINKVKIVDPKEKPSTQQLNDIWQAIENFKTVVIEEKCIEWLLDVVLPNIPVDDGEAVTDFEKKENSAKSVGDSDFKNGFSECFKKIVTPALKTPLDLFTRALQEKKAINASGKNLLMKIRDMNADRRKKVIPQLMNTCDSIKKLLRDKNFSALNSHTLEIARMKHFFKETNHLEMLIQNLQETQDTQKIYTVLQDLEDHYQLKKISRWPSKWLIAGSAVVLGVISYLGYKHFWRR